jgi:magnesium-transporting ATPase (P-type)
VTLLAFWLALPDGEAHARTAAFMTLALAQILHLGNARSVGPVLRPARALANRWALAAVALSLGLQLVAFAPLGAVLDLAPPTAREWLWIAALGAVPALVGQVTKLLRGPR